MADSPRRTFRGLRLIRAGLARLLFWILPTVFVAAPVLAEDEVELLSGTRVQGKILERTKQNIKVEVTVANQPLIRSYPLHRVRAITQNGQRELLNPPSADAPKSEAAAASSGATSTASSSSSEVPQRTAQAVDSLIERMGRTPPDWFDSTLLEYPQTLDLSWPEPTPIIWNYTRNVDHYIWDIINSNPKRYQSGVRLMHHLLVVNQNNEGTRARVMNELGRMYFEFFRDYARAAFWWRQAKVDLNLKFSQSPSSARLAECYWRLGNRPRAVELLDRLPLTTAVIKAWGDLRETEKALRLCDEGIKSGFAPSQIYLLAGDACRAAKDFSRATEFYRKVLEVPKLGNQAEPVKRDQERAQATLEVIRLFDTLDVNRIPDGNYSGKSLGYYGNVEVQVAVKAKRVDTITVTHNPDRQYYHAVDETIRRILEKQTVNGVDAISGASVTSEAVIRGSAKALAEGMSTHAVRK